MEQKKPGPGGRRAGAGRPRILDRRKMLTISLEREEYDALKSLAKQRSESFAAVVRAAVRSYVRRQRRR